MKKMSLLAAALSAACLISLILPGCTDRTQLESSSLPEPSSSVPEPPSSSSLPQEPEEPEEESSQPEESRPDINAISLDYDAIARLSGEPVTWGPSTQMNEDNRPIACEGLQEQYDQYDAYFIAPNEKKIYLTFDEGYENGYTDDILDVLKEKDVSAVFFVTGGYVRQNPELIQRMIDEGHVVGSHSDQHLNFPEATAEEGAEDIKTLHNLVKEQFGYEMEYFRFPEGVFSEQNLEMLQSLGYTSLFWSYAYADWDPNNQMDPDTAYAKVTAALHPGAIYLLHAVSATNAQILGDFIDYVRAQGYEISPMDL